MEPDDATETTLKLQACLQKFIDDVNALQNEDDPTGDGFTREYKDIREQGIRDKEENRYPAQEGRKTFNIKKNRYKDILPYDDSRVPLDPIAGEEGSDYINANFIEDHNGLRCYIASQGPVPNTVYDFWRMVLQYEVKVIAMACRLIEMGRQKCEQYWPERVNETVEFKDISVTMTAEEELAEHCMMRKLTARRGSSPVYEVTQFHYTGWPDHGIPRDFDAILEMMALMREIKRHDPNKAPFVIHCSAGCGRTGTICAIDYSWDMLKTGKMDDSYSLNEIVKNMRTQRPSMIQTPEQYMMAHIMVQTLFQKHLDLMEDHTYGNFNFNSQEEDELSSHQSTPNTSRKNSILQADIESTLALISHAPIKEEPEISPVSHQKMPDKPSLPKKPVDISPPSKPPLTAKPSLDQAGSVSAQPGKQSEMIDRKRGGSYKVVKIENIPKSDAPNPIEQRYLSALGGEKSDPDKRPLSYKSSEEGRHDLQSKKALFEGGNRTSTELTSPTLLTSPTKQNTKHESSFQFEKVNTNPVSTNVKTEMHRPDAKRSSTQGQAGKPDINSTVQRTFSTPAASLNQSQKHVTILKVGGTTTTNSKPDLKKTTSAPYANENLKKDINNKAKPLSQKMSQHMSGTPQPSIPPEFPAPRETEAEYSLAGNSHEYSILSSGYSYAAPSVQIDASKSEAPKNESSQPTDNKSRYSLMTNYSSVNGNASSAKPGVTTEEYSYSNPTGPDSNVRQSQFSGGTGDLYAAVDKGSKGVSNQGLISDGVYESVEMGNGGQAAPPIPDRQYLEDEQADDSMAGQSSNDKQGLKAGIKALFNFKGVTKTGASEGLNSSTIPGFKGRIGKKPQGQKEAPKSWKNK